MVKVSKKKKKIVPVYFVQNYFHDCCQLNIKSSQMNYELVTIDKDCFKVQKKFVPSLFVKRLINLIFSIHAEIVKLLGNWFSSLNKEFNKCCCYKFTLS